MTDAMTISTRTITLSTPVMRNRKRVCGARGMHAHDVSTIQRTRRRDAHARTSFTVIHRSYSL